MTLHCGAKTRYYKYTYAKWTQPVLTSDTSHGTLTGSGYYNSSGVNRGYWHISDGIIPTTNDGSDNWGTNNSASGWVNWALPEEIIITGIKVYNRFHSTAVDYQLTGARFYTDSSKSTPIGEEFSITTSGGVYELKNIPAGGIKTKNIYFSKTGNTYSGIGELVITAKKVTGQVETDETDYDFSVFNDGSIKQIYKGSTAMALAYKGSDLLWSIYPINGTVFEKSAAGTYTFTPLASGAYEISLVGGGGGGACAGDQSSYAYKSRAGGGGSGAYVCGVWNLVGGTSYSITVGAAGAAGPSNKNDSTGSAGGTSSFASYITCTGGGGGDAHWKGAGTGGAAGTVSKCTGYTRLITSTAGNAGAGASSYNVAAGGSARLGSYGAGGSGQATGNYAGVTKPGNAGYCKIRYVVS